jgi:hypothetical protein
VGFVLIAGERRSRPEAHRPAFFTQAVFSDANPVLAWSQAEDCPWEPSDSRGDMISYNDFRGVWNVDSVTCPGATQFSRMMQQVQRPGGGTVEKVAAGEPMVNYVTGPNRPDNLPAVPAGYRTRPFLYVRWRE